MNFILEAAWTIWSLIFYSYYVIHIEFFKQKQIFSFKHMYIQYSHSNWNVLCLFWNCKLLLNIVFVSACSYASVYLYTRMYIYIDGCVYPFYYIWQFSMLAFNKGFPTFFRHDGSQCACNHGPGRSQETNWEHEIPSFNGALASIEKYCRVSKFAFFLNQFFAIFNARRLFLYVKTNN